jgi:hypothetical protein
MHIEGAKNIRFRCKEGRGCHITLIGKHIVNSQPLVTERPRWSTILAGLSLKMHSLSFILMVSKSINEVNVDIYCHDILHLGSYWIKYKRDIKTDESTSTFPLSLGSLSPPSSMNISLNLFFKILGK